MDINKINKKQEEFNKKIFDAEQKGDFELAQKLEKDKTKYLLDLRDSSEGAKEYQKKLEKLKSELTEIGLSEDSIKLLLK